MIFVLVASPLQHAFNLHQAVLDQVHSLRLDRSLEQQRHQFDARQVHRFSKMLLHDLKKFDNFASVLGISSFLYRKIGTFQSY